MVSGPYSYAAYGVKAWGIMSDQIICNLGCKMYWGEMKSIKVGKCSISIVKDALFPKNDLYQCFISFLNVQYLDW